MFESYNPNETELCNQDVGQFAKTTARADGRIAPCSKSSLSQRPLRFLRAVRLALNSLA